MSTHYIQILLLILSEKVLYMELCVCMFTVNPCQPE